MYAIRSYYERYRLLGVGPDGHRRRMIGQYENGQVSFAPGAGQDGPHHILVDPLDGPDLVRCAPVMSRLVGRFHMDQSYNFV